MREKFRFTATFVKSDNRALGCPAVDAFDIVFFRKIIRFTAR
jgi:hypothetical protein